MTWRIPRNLLPIVLVSTGLQACSVGQYHPPSVDSIAGVDVVSARGSRCYTTSQGVEVRAFEGDCPQRTVVERELSCYLQRVAGDPADLEGIIVITTPHTLQCGAYRTTGCVENGAALAQLRGFPGEWAESIVHEVSHIHQDRLGMDPDPLNARPDWARVIERMEVCHRLVSRPWRRGAWQEASTSPGTITF